MAEMSLHIHAKDMECPGCFREGLEAGLAKYQWQPIEAAEAMRLANRGEHVRCRDDGQWFHLPSYLPLPPRPEGGE